jgi:hypothetical protein
MARNDEFFVGYLNTPQRLATFYKVLTPILIVSIIALGVWFGLSQKSAGKGVWDLSGPSTISGYLTVDPYPVIHYVGEEKRSVILVQQGKKSANPLAKNHANQWVTISGFAIARGDWSMLELTSESAFAIAENQTPVDFKSTPLGDIALRGEIIDSKCFLGVMKPGSGKAHRACAAMCLRGGMPPMFVATSTEGEKFGYMLMHPNGESASLDLIEDVGLPVELKGSLEKRGDMLYIRYDATSVTRLEVTGLFPSESAGESPGESSSTKVAVNGSLPASGQDAFTTIVATQ